MPNLLIHREGQTFGPYAREDVLGFMQAGELQSTDMAWTEGLLDWAPLQAVLARLQPTHADEPPSVFTGLAWWDTIPEGVRGFSWGALLAGPIWAIGNRVWPALWCWLPGLGLLVNVWMGFKGRELAWRRGGWQSIEHFQRVQGRWTIWGIVIFVAVVALTAAVVLFKGPQLTAQQGQQAKPEQAAPVQPVPAPAERREAQPAQDAPQGQEPVQAQQPAEQGGQAGGEEPIQGPIEPGHPVTRTRLEAHVMGLAEQQVRELLGAPIKEINQDGAKGLGYVGITQNPQTGKPDTVTVVVIYQGKVAAIQYPEVNR